jgi:hypothetical protein
MSLPTIYNYDAITRVFVGTGLADHDPLDPNGFLLPAHATLVPVLQSVPQGQVAVFDVDAQAWATVAAEIFNPQQPDAEPASLDTLILQAQVRIDQQFELLYQSSVPSPSITKEYESAYQQAQKWLQSLAGPIVMIMPERIAALAESMSTPDKPVTTRAAAEYVVQKYQDAERVLDLRGAARLRAKAAIRAAPTLRAWPMRSPPASPR